VSAAPPLRVLIVDDEPLARDCLRLPLAARPDIELVGECPDGASAVERIVDDAPDLVFLDIQMPGVDGFEVIERVGADKMPALIFVTAYGQHAVRAFEVHALNYLMKPFTSARLYAAIEHAKARLVRWQDDETLARLERLRGEGAFGGQRAGEAPRPVSRLLVREGDRFRFLKVDEVLWFEACRNHVRAHLEGSSHLVATTLVALAERLDPERFVRCHRSNILNLDAVREIQPWFGGDYVAILTNGQQVRVSRTHRDALLRPLA
jgi:two-component system, LytTR family, response regulator